MSKLFGLDWQKYDVDRMTMLRMVNQEISEEEAEQAKKAK